MIDTIEQIETPEGVSLSLNLAGLPVRSIAYMIDWGIKVAFYIVLGLIAGGLGGGLGKTVFTLCVFFMEWFYPVFFEVYKNGQTPGKKKMGLMVLNDNGTPVSAQAAVIRNFVRFGDLLPGAYLTGVIAMLCDKKMRRVGDLAAGTVVVYTDKSWKKKAELPDVEPKMLPVDLTAEEKLAIVSFAERSELISELRQLELSKIITDLHGEKGRDGVEEIYKYAKGILGE